MLRILATHGDVLYLTGKKVGKYLVTTSVAQHPVNNANVA